MLQDIHLVLFVLVPVSVDVVLITVWYYNDPLETENAVLNKLFVHNVSFVSHIRAVTVHLKVESIQREESI